MPDDVALLRWSHCTTCQSCRSQGAHEDAACCGWQPRATRHALDRLRFQSRCCSEGLPPRRVDATDAEAEARWQHEEDTRPEDHCGGCCAGRPHLAVLQEDASLSVQSGLARKLALGLNRQHSNNTGVALTLHLQVRYHDAAVISLLGHANFSHQLCCLHLCCMHNMHSI